MIAFAASVGTESLLRFYGAAALGVLIGVVGTAILVAAFRRRDERLGLRKKTQYITTILYQQGPDVADSGMV